MTPEDMRKAMAAYAAYYERMEGIVSDAEDTFLAGWEAAAAEEREACAKEAERIAEEREDAIKEGSPNTAREVADAIRARRSVGGSEQGGGDR